MSGAVMFLLKDGLLGLPSAPDVVRRFLDQDQRQRATARAFSEKWLVEDRLGAYAIEVGERAAGHWEDTYDDDECECCR